MTDSTQNSDCGCKKLSLTKDARAQPLVTETSPLDALPPTSSRFGTPLKLSEVQWVRPELVCETRFLAWTSDGMLRQALYQGVRDTPAHDVRHNPTDG